MKHALFDADGFLVCLITNPSNVIIGKDQRLVAVPDDADANALFLTDAGAIVPEPVELPAFRTIAACDRDEAVTITGLPFSCWITVNGVRQHVESGSYQLTSSQPHQAFWALTGAHRCEPILLRFDAATVLMDEVRAERDQRLAQSDWTQARDIDLPEALVTQWANYRRALRDLPTNQPLATIETVEWPAPPSKL